MQGNNDTATFSSPDDEEFFGAIGRLTISWAHLELGLDCMVEILTAGLRAIRSSLRCLATCNAKSLTCGLHFRNFLLGQKQSKAT